MFSVHKVFGSLPAVTLTFDLLTPKSKHHIYELKYVCGQSWVTFPLLFFFDVVFTRFSGLTGSLAHSLTHSLADRPNYRMPSAPFFNGGGGI